MNGYLREHMGLLLFTFAALLVATGVYAEPMPAGVVSIENVVYKTWDDEEGPQELLLDIYIPHPDNATDPMKFHVFFPDFYADRTQVLDDAAVNEVFSILAQKGFTGISVDYRGENYLELLMEGMGPIDGIESLNGDFIPEPSVFKVFNPLADAMDAVTFVRDRYKRVDSARGKHLAVWGAGKLGGHTALMAALAYGEPGLWEPALASRRLFRSGSLRRQVFPTAVAAWSPKAAPGLLFGLIDDELFDLPAYMATLLFGDEDDPDWPGLLEILSPTTYLQERSLPVLLAPNPAYLDAFEDGNVHFVNEVILGPVTEAVPEADLPPIMGFLPYIFDLHATRMVETAVYQKATVHHIAAPEWLKVRWFLDMACGQFAQPVHQIDDNATSPCPPQLQMLAEFPAYPGLDDVPIMTAEFIYQNTDPAALPGSPPDPQGSNWTPPLTR